MYQGPAQQPQGFPPTLDAVPDHARLSETFAFIPGALALGGVFGLIGLMIGISQHGFNDLGQLLWPAGCFVIAVLFGFWEIWRRTHRTSVAFLGDQIGVYRSGALQQVAYRSQITIYQLNIVNTLRELMLFGILALAGVCGGVGELDKDLGFGLAGIGFAIGSVGALVSSIYARIACRHFFVPQGNGTEQVMFTRGAAGRFGL
jgi:hypothetical protein